MFLRLRRLAGITHDGEGNPVEIPDGFFAGVFSCVWCCSVWVGVGWVAFLLANPRWAEVAALPFALSAGAILIECVIDKLK